MDIDKVINMTIIKDGNILRHIPDGEFGYYWDDFNKRWWPYYKMIKGGKNDTKSN